MKTNKLEACICEGAAEKTIMEILLENNLLSFDYNDVIDLLNPILGSYYRNHINFENEYLNKYSQKKIIIYYINDSTKEHFKISKKYFSLVEVVEFKTTPEIEILYIIAQNKYKDFQKYKSSMKPSEYVSNILKVKSVKNYNFIKSYFTIGILLDVLKYYNKTIKNHKTIYDLLELK
ncbi:MAG: hypothetical protein LBV51_00855 [Acholeplasmatales bacterium]|jgi:hypothetical protein|nr:hypothetical protein [Acholeplasmatales bacterium]